MIRSKKYFFIVLMMYTSLYLNGCRDDEKVLPKDLDTSQIIPLRLGNSWSFEVTRFDTEGNVKAKTDTLKLMITGFRVLNGDSLYYLDQHYIEYANRKDGFWYVTSIGEGLMFKYPIEVGETYKIDGIEIELVSKDVEVEVSAGKFKCYHYRNYFKGMASNSYLAPGVGWIRTEGVGSFNDGPPFLSHIEELKEYNLN